MEAGSTRKAPELFVRYIKRTQHTAYFLSKENLFKWKRAMIPDVLNFRAIGVSRGEWELSWTTEEVVFG